MTMLCQFNDTALTEACTPAGALGGAAQQGCPPQLSSSGAECQLGQPAHPLLLLAEQHLAAKHSSEQLVSWQNAGSASRGWYTIASIDPFKCERRLCLCGYV